jgi:peptidoglycan/xylan/chitin deacetylase (PgdA/CDA1 family)
MIRSVRGWQRWRYLPVRLLGAPTAFLLCHACRLSSQKVALALVYHSIGDRDGDPTSQLVPPHGAATFQAHMRFARRCFEIVPASELVPAMGRRRRGGRIPLTVTFDDDLSSHRIAAAVLRELRLTATFFLTGATLDGPSSFWWQLLQTCYERGLGAQAAAIAGVDGAALHAVALSIQHMPRRERELVRARLGELLGGTETEPGLRADDVRALVAGRAEVGFHTLHHDYLPDLPDAALDAAVSEGRDRLESAAGERIRTIAYPHGGADERVARAARRAPFPYGFAGEPSAIKLGDDPLLLARIEPPRAGAGRFGMRVARHLLEGLRS